MFEYSSELLVSHCGFHLQFSDEHFFLCLCEGSIKIRCLFLKWVVFLLILRIFFFFLRYLLIYLTQRKSVHKQGEADRGRKRASEQRVPTWGSIQGFWDHDLGPAKGRHLTN